MRQKASDRYTRIGALQWSIRGNDMRPAAAMLTHSDLVVRPHWSSCSRTDAGMHEVNVGGLDRRELKPRYAALPMDVIVSETP